MTATTGPMPFPAQTAWSVILGAASRNSADSEKHFQSMVQTYWRPVYWYLVKRWSCPREDALDLTQEFFLRLYEKDFLGQASPERGRFRTFLKLQLRNLVVDDLRRRNAQKRGGGVPVAGDVGIEPAWNGPSPEEEFDRLWAEQLLLVAMRELEASMTAEGKETPFRAFSMCCAGRTPMSYRECADALGLKENDVRGYIHRARQRLKEILVRRVRETVEHDRDAEEELNGLLQLLKR